MNFRRLLPWVLVAAAVALGAFLAWFPVEPRAQAETYRIFEAPSPSPDAVYLSPTRQRYERLRAVNEGLERGLLEKWEAARK